MPLIKNVHDRHHLHGVAITVGSVHVVLYSDKAYSECGEHIIDVLPDLNIVSSEARKVFHDYGVNNARLCVV